MKKIILTIALMLLACIALNAQSKVYCEILGKQQFLSKKVQVQVDFGQKTNLFADNPLVDEKGNVIEFNSMVDALNYMGTMGWEFEQAYAVTAVWGSTTLIVYHWLLSKYVGEEGDANSLRTRGAVIF